MHDGFGSGTLAHAVHKRVIGIDADVITLDGIRSWSQAKMLRSFPKHILVYITAGARIRYARAQARKENEGEEHTSFEQFLIEDQSPAESLISAIGNTADFIVENTGTIGDFERQVGEFLSCYYGQISQEEIL